MTTDTATTEMIPSGVYIFYRCRDEVNKMLPSDKDPPYANFMMDIKCERSVQFVHIIFESVTPLSASAADPLSCDRCGRSSA